VEKLQENIKKNGKKSFNGTPKPITMGVAKRKHKVEKKFLRENWSLNFV
jgi:hypothetical protein